MNNDLLPRLLRLATKSRATCAVLLVMILALLTQACALDMTALENRRADMDALCQQPRTLALAAACQRMGYTAPRLTDSDASQ